MGRSDQVVVEPNSRRVVRYRQDSVGNDLTAVLAWCSTHREPVWVFADGSTSTCPHQVVVGWDPDGHEIVDGPWEFRDDPTTPASG